MLFAYIFKLLLYRPYTTSNNNTHYGNHILCWNYFDYVLCKTSKRKIKKKFVDVESICSFVRLFIPFIHFIYLFIYCTKSNLCCLMEFIFIKPLNLFVASVCFWLLWEVKCIWACCSLYQNEYFKLNFLWVLCRDCI